MILLRPIMFSLLIVSAGCTFSGFGNKSSSSFFKSLTTNQTVVPGSTPVTDQSGTPSGPNGASLTFSKVVVGSGFSCALASGSIYCWGKNSNGQLGNGTLVDSSIPVKALNIDGNAIDIAIGGTQTCAALADQTISCWGSGQSTTPIFLPNSGGFVSHLALGNGFGCALFSSGVKCWGNVPAASSSATPNLVTGLESGVTELSANGGTFCAVQNGAAKCLGFGSNGILGNGSNANSASPVQVSGLTSGVSRVSVGNMNACAVLMNGSVMCWGQGNLLPNGSNSSVPVDVSQLVGGSAQNIVLGLDFACAQVSNTLKCWGSNSSGQLGTGVMTSVNLNYPLLPATTVSNLPSSLTSIAASIDHVCAASSSVLRCWGNNEFGQLGLGTRGNQNAPVIVPGITGGATQVSAGLYHTCAVVSGAVKCWGRNHSGQLGNGTTNDSSTPVNVIGISSGATEVQVGRSHSCALVNGAVKCWGSNAFGQLGNGTTSDSLTPVSILEYTSGAIALSLGWDHTCVISAGQTLRCWGQNAWGGLGIGWWAVLPSYSTPQSPVLAETGNSGISLGGNHTCSRRENSVYCWGMNSSGQLGIGSTTNMNYKSDPIIGSLTAITELDSESNRSCAINSGILYCWGESAGPSGNSSVPVQVVNLVGAGATKLAVGHAHQCWGETSGLKCMGSNAMGALGLGHENNVTAPANVPGFEVAPTSLAAGQHHTCAVYLGVVYCWGNGTYGKLGTPYAVATPSAVLF